MKPIQLDPQQRQELQRRRHQTHDNKHRQRPGDGAGAIPDDCARLEGLNAIVKRGSSGGWCRYPDGGAAVRHLAYSP
jgi:hypothetical protein